MEEVGKRRRRRKKGQYPTNGMPPMDGARAGHCFPRLATEQAAYLLFISHPFIKMVTSASEHQ